MADGAVILRPAEPPLNPEAVLLAALRTAPRRYRMPPLPADGAAAAAAPAETALAWAIECARQAGPAAPAQAQHVFTTALAASIRQAMAPGGDPTFRALVLRSGEPQVDAYLRLAAHASADARAVRAAVNRMAHPGKTRDLPPARQALLARWHALAAAGAWPALQQALAAEPLLDERHGLRLARLVQAAALQDVPAVRRYLALCEERGPLAGTAAATAQGRRSARLGEVAEQATWQAFQRIAALLDPAGERCRAVRSLKTPPGFPGDGAKAKEEWDAAILRMAGPEAAAEVLLLAEVKAAPAAATPDFSRLHRGLLRLAQAQPDQGIAGASLRRLAPRGRDLPPHVIYCSSAPAEAQPPMLSAATRAVLLAENESVALARALEAGAAPAADTLAGVWHALQAQPRLRSALHQYDTARRVREAMLHPDDLLTAVALRLPPATPT
jgi:hypothetical protein